MTFWSRDEAGEKLGLHLLREKVCGDIIAGLPRGGVLVAAKAGERMGLPVQALVVRKIGHPRFREFAVGALAEGGVVVLDSAVVERSGIAQEDLERVIAEERERLVEYSETFARCPRSSMEGKVVIVVDDGLATGATMEAAAQSARQQGARRVIAAVPVASVSGIERMRRTCEEVHAIWVDPAFEAVGQYYKRFPQTTDEEALERLKEEG